MDNKLVTLSAGVKYDCLAAGLGIVLGGYLIRRFDLDMVGCAKMATFTSILSICLIIPVFFLKCGSAPIAGVTVDYPLGLLLLVLLGITIF